MVSPASIDSLMRQGEIDLWGAARNDPPLPLAPALPIAITLVKRFHPQSLTGMDRAPTPDYYREYCRLNEALDEAASRLTQLLHEAGHEALAVPATLDDDAVQDWGEAGVFAHKTAATQAGLGWIGKTALFVSPELGPKVRLATVFTDFELHYGRPVIESGCGPCRRCVDACPADAGRDVRWHAGMPRSELYEEKACEAHLDTFVDLGGVCGVCVAACPFGRQ
jgi:epoxyqueuosine reductase QueG